MDDENEPALPQWKLRSQVFARSLGQVTEAAAIPSDELDSLRRAGLILNFILAVELAWKTAKDFASTEGIESDSPRAAMANAFHLGLIQDSELWNRILRDRNLLVHVYDEDVLDDKLSLIKDSYLPALTNFLAELSQR